MAIAAICPKTVSLWAKFLKLEVMALTCLANGMYAGSSSKSRGTNRTGLSRGDLTVFYGITGGAASYFDLPTLTEDDRTIETPKDADYYFTDDVSDHACSFIQDHLEQRPDQPFFLYAAYTAPHWPLHAKPEKIAKYKGRFSKGWDVLRQWRLKRMIEMGILDENTELTKRDSTQPAWEDVPNKEWQERRMEVYAAQVDSMDQGIGRIIETLEASGELGNTLILFLSDNGACAEKFSTRFFL